MKAVLAKMPRLNDHSVPRGKIHATLKIKELLLLFLIIKVKAKAFLTYFFICYLKLGLYVNNRALAYTMVDFI